MVLSIKVIGNNLVTENKGVFMLKKNMLLKIVVSIGFFINSITDANAQQIIYHANCLLTQNVSYDSIDNELIRLGYSKPIQGMNSQLSFSFEQNNGKGEYCASISGFQNGEEPQTYESCNFDLLTAISQLPECRIYNN